MNSTLRVLSFAPMEDRELRKIIRVKARVLFDLCTTKQEDRKQSKPFLLDWLRSNVYNIEDLEAGIQRGPNLDHIKFVGDNVTLVDNYKRAINVFLKHDPRWMGYRTLFNALDGRDLDIGDGGTSITQVRVAKLKLMDDLEEAVAMNSLRQRCCVLFSSTVTFVVGFVGLFVVLYTTFHN
jgi:hypothetical protein